MTYQIVKFNDDDDQVGSEIDVAYFDGYVIGERLLEGVVFVVTLTEDKSDVLVQVFFQHKKYFEEKTNSSKWLKEAKEHALTYDAFSSTHMCNDDDVAIIKL